MGVKEITATNTWGLKASEVRVGNIISNGSDYVIVSNDNISFILSNLTNYCPVGLTEEILFDSGFRKVSDTQRYFLDRVEGYFLIFSGKLGLACKRGSKPVGVPICYVHQLQNTFYCLTGDELTIPL